MIKIKDLIINENEIVYIEEFDAESLGIMFKGKDKATFVDAHPEDIEWNYDSQEQQYNEETEQLISSLKIKNYKLQDRIKELEEDSEAEKSTSSNLSKRILNTLNVLENVYMLENVTISNNVCKEIDKSIKILKGE